MMKLVGLFYIGFPYAYVKCNSERKPYFRCGSDSSPTIVILPSVSGPCLSSSIQLNLSLIC